MVTRAYPTIHPCISGSSVLVRQPKTNQSAIRNSSCVHRRDGEEDKKGLCRLRLLSLEFRSLGDCVDRRVAYVLWSRKQEGEVAVRGNQKRMNKHGKCKFEDNKKTFTMFTLSDGGWWFILSCPSYSRDVHMVRYSVLVFCCSSSDTSV